MRTALALIFITGMAASAQPRPTFEVASIRPAQQPGREDIETVPGRLTMRNMRLGACIQWAYDLQEYQVSGPAWINDPRFDIVAKASGPATTEELRGMLQVLLAERFRLEAHRQTKEMQALILVVGKNGHKLKPVEKEGSPSFKTGKLNLTGTGATVAQLTRFLSRELKNPVIDQTGLAGRYDYFLDINAFVTEEMRKAEGPPVEAPSIIARAVQEQLGLKIESKKIPIETLAIDRVDRESTGN